MSVILTLPNSISSLNYLMVHLCLISFESLSRTILTVVFSLSCVRERSLHRSCVHLHAERIRIVSRHLMRFEGYAVRSEETTFWTRLIYRFRNDSQRVSWTNARRVPDRTRADTFNYIHLSGVFCFRDGGGGRAACPSIIGIA